jgi:hypothetical protein
VLTGSAPNPADRTGRFLQRLGIDQAAVAAGSRDVVVELVADQLNPAVEVSVALTTTLLLRLADFAPTIHLVVPQDRTVALPRLADTPLVDALTDAHTGFASTDRLRSGRADRYDLRLVFAGQADGLPVSAAGWAVAVGHRLDGTGNALAAAYAGVLAATEAFKTVLAHLGVMPERARPWRGVVSLWDYSMSAAAGPDLTRADIGEHAWIGAGGVASAAAWSLAALHQTGVALTGHGLVVDADTIDEEGTNLNRHLIALMSDRGAGKADLLSKVLTAGELALTRRSCRWEELSRITRQPRLAVVSVDDDAVRRAVQLDMPATIINAGTGDRGEYQASRHNFLDDCCLSCIAQADKATSGPDASLARRLGLPLDTLRPLLRSSAPLPADVLARSGLTGSERAEVASVAGRDLLQRYCDRLRLDDDGPAVSAPMLSAAAGTLLAVEMVKLSQEGAPSVPGQVVRTTILAGPHERWSSTRGKTPGCHCEEDVYRQHYHRRWPA